MRMPSRSNSVLIPILLLLVAIISIQWSAALAKDLFHRLNPAGVTALRLGWSAVILLCVLRPWRNPVPKGAWKLILLYGASLGGMNTCFYLALQYLPLGVAVGLEFTGPLLLALFGSRRKSDLLWAVLAIFGVVLLLPIWDGALDQPGAIKPLGLVFITMASLCWVMYIIFGKKAGMAGGPTTVGYAMAVAACMILPIGFSIEGTALLALDILPTAFAIGLFSSALPYGLEIYALAKLPTRTFGILMSLEPAFAALSGFLFLSEQLTLGQWTALLCIVVASAGSTMSSQDGAAPSGIKDGTAPSGIKDGSD